MKFNAFGFFLVENNVIDEDTLAEVLEVHSKQTKYLIGELALKHGIISTKEVFQILNRQAESSKLFGEIAIELGFMTKFDVIKLLSIQHKMRTSVGQILVEQNHISNTQHNELLREFLDQELLEKNIA